MHCLPVFKSCCTYAHPHPSRKSKKTYQRLKKWSYFAKRATFEEIFWRCKSLVCQLLLSLSTIYHKYLLLCILYLKPIHKIAYNKKLINVDWLMLHSLQETKYDALLLLLLLQPTQIKLKQQQPYQQQKTRQFKYDNSTKASRLHFSDLQ